MIIALSWLGVLLQIVGLTLNGRKKMACWPVWLASNAALFAYFTLTAQWAFVILQFIFVYRNASGWIQWRKQAAIDAIVTEISGLVGREKFDAAERRIEDLAALAGDNYPEVLRMRTLMSFLLGDD